MSNWNSARGALTLLCLAAACAHAPTSKPEKPAIIKSEGPFATILQIDGRLALRRFLLPLLSNRLIKAKLTPGEHTLTVLYGPGLPYFTFPMYRFKLSAESGHTYLVKYGAEREPERGLLEFPKRAPEFSRLWIADAESGKEVGKVLETMNEPVRDATILGLSDFFTWSPPQGEKPMVLSRHIDGLTVNWEGAPNLDWKGSTFVDSYSAMIRVYELPELKTAEEFTNHVRQARQEAHAKRDWIRLKDLDESVETIASGADFCVKTRHLSTVRAQTRLRSQSSGGGSGLAGAAGSIPNEAILPLAAIVAVATLATSPWLKSDTILESYGYNCRIPAKKGFGIVFEYSHRFIKDRKDPAMAEQAETYFSQLKF